MMNNEPDDWDGPAELVTLGGEELILRGLCYLRNRETGWYAQFEIEGTDVTVGGYLRLRASNRSWEALAIPSAILRRPDGALRLELRGAGPWPPSVSLGRAVPEPGAKL